jgi:hypothetical protein
VSRIALAQLIDAIDRSCRVGKIRFDEAAEGLFNDYRTNKKCSLKTITIRIDEHLRPFSGGRRKRSIGTALTGVFVAKRQAASALNAEINRELIALRRMFTLALKAASS